MVQGKPSQDVPENVPPSRPGPEQRQPSEATIRSMSSASSTGTVRRVSTDEGPYVDLSSEQHSFSKALSLGIFPLSLYSHTKTCSFRFLEPERR